MKHIAADLGAESGRIIVGDLSGIEVIRRFPSKSVERDGHFFWDIEGIISEIIDGLGEAFAKYGGDIVSVGVDTWGVDYVLLDKDNNLLGMPYHYRDSRTDSVMPAVIGDLGKEFIYGRTGIQFMQFNSIFQLAADRDSREDRLGKADKFLTIPDYINFRLSGVIANEFSNATTTQLLNPLKKEWAWDLIDKLALPKHIFQKIIMPGTILGGLLPEIAEKTGAPKNVKVVVPACHDTGSAVAAVPALENKPEYAYISSGTWSLLGFELDNPLINSGSLEMNYTNEGSAFGGVRFLKNIMGLWIIQQCRNNWLRENPDLSYDNIEDLAKQTECFDFFINVDDPCFLKPESKNDTMDERVRSFCREADLPVPKTIGETAKLVFCSLAEQYARTMKKGEEITGYKCKKLYIIGGGSKQKYLCELTACRTGLTVSAGPKEATALGNILLQAMAMKSVSSVGEGRDRIRKAFSVKEYLPYE